MRNEGSGPVVAALRLERQGHAPPFRSRGPSTLPHDDPADKRDSRGRHWPGCLLRRTVVMKGDWVQERDDRGFTLIELLIVIVILGVLAAIVVLAVGGVRSDATASACKADGRLVDTA